MTPGNVKRKLIGLREMSQNIAFTPFPHIAIASVDLVSSTIGMFLGRITQQRAAVAATDLIERILTSVTESSPALLIIVEILPPVDPAVDSVTDAVEFPPDPPDDKFESPVPYLMCVCVCVC